MKKNIYESAYFDELEGNKQSRFELLKSAFNLDNIVIDSDEFKNKVIELLNIAVIDEQLAELNYLSAYNLSKTDGKVDFDPEFKQHEDDERQHKHNFINRLRELNGEVLGSPIKLWEERNSRGSNWKQEFSNNSNEILLNRLEEEKQAVEFYTLCISYTKDSCDSTTYKLFKKTKEDEEKHLLELRDLAREKGIYGINEE